jgi:hypothetical protein
MFGSQHEYYLALKQWTNMSHHTLLMGVAGALAGLTEATLTPFERVQAVLQVEKFHTSYTNSLHVFQQVTKLHGYRELYRGFSAICIRNSLSNFIFFTARQPLKSVFPAARSKLENVVYDFMSGGLLGATISTLFYPLNVVKSHMQVKIGGEFMSVKAAFRTIYVARDRRLLNMFKGVHGNFIRAIFSWGITNSVYELVLPSIKSKSNKNS